VIAAAAPLDDKSDGNRVPDAAVAFARLLRRCGLDVPVDTVVTFTHALGETGIDRRRDVYWAGRATLVRRHEDIALFDRAFAAFWDRTDGMRVELAKEAEQITLALDDDDESDGDGDGDAVERDEPTITVRFSVHESLQHKDFGDYSPTELAEAHQLMSQWRFVGAPRSSRRRRPSHRPTDRLDVRRTVRASLRSGGEPMRRHHLRVGERPRRLVLLLDVSGSMEPYARALVRFVHAAVVGRRKVEAFTLGTRLTRITRELSSRDPDLALDRAASSVADWSGGTRLGDGIRRFNDEWGQRGMARGAIVVVLSDGWDRGDPAVMAEQMQRLARVAYRIVWVNPLRATPGYAPLARGMAAALPYVDDFIDGHSLDAIERLAACISDQSPARRAA
jgi:uncharacterized protein